MANMATPAAGGGLQSLQALKAQAPNGKDMSDAQFAVAMHQHYYPDMPMADYLAKMGLDRGNVLYELRAPGDPYGDYLRQSLATPGTGETQQQADVRQGGQIESRKVGTGEGMARAALQGMTFGFGDELTAAGSAALDPFVNGNPTNADFGQRFNTYLSREQGQVNNFRQDNPAAAYGTEIAGAVLSPANAVFGPLAAMGAKGGTAAKIFGGLGASALEGGVYGFGSTDGDLAQRGQGAAMGAGLGAVGGVVAPLAARGAQAAYRGTQQAVRRMANAGAVRRAMQAAPSAATLKAGSQAAYGAVKATGAEIAQRSTQAMRSRARQLFTDEGLVFPSGQLAKGYPKLKNAWETMVQYMQGPVNMTEAQRIARMIRRAAESSDGDEARVGMKLLNEFESYMDALPMSAFQKGNGQQAVKMWTQARNEWARYRRTQTVEQAIQNASLSRHGFAQGMRDQFATILKSPKRQRGFTTDELGMMRKVAEGAPIEDFLRFLQRGGAVPAYWLGHITGGPLWGATAAAGKMLGNVGIKGLSNAQSRRAANMVRAQVATPGGLPLPRALPPPIPIPDTFRRLGARVPAIVNGG